MINIEDFPIIAAASEPPMPFSLARCHSASLVMISTISVTRPLSGHSAGYAGESLGPVLCAFFFAVDGSFGGLLFPYFRVAAHIRPHWYAIGRRGDEGLQTSEPKPGLFCKRVAPVVVELMRLYLL